MPYRNERYRRRKQKRTAIIGIVVAALLIEIVVVIVLLSRDCSGRRSTPDLTSQQTAPAATETPVPEDTSVPAETPISVPTPSPAPAKQSHAVNGYLPIYEKVDTSEKVIAVTVDDLLQPTNLKKICQLAKDYNAKLTLFPIGKMLEREDIRSTVKRAYEELGFEIENHTYGHNRLYMEDEAGLANAVCKQQMLVNDTLGVNYQMHFLRMQGGNGERILALINIWISSAIGESRAGPTAAAMPTSLPLKSICAPAVSTCSIRQTQISNGFRSLSPMPSARDTDW